jgi:hypothetical protein
MKKTKEESAEIADIDEKEETSTAVVDTSDLDGVENLPVPATSAPALTFGEISGDFDDSKVIIPRLYITYGVGALATEFNPGDLLLDKEHLIAHKDEELNVIVMSMSNYWKENKKWDPTDKSLPNIINSKDEVLEQGFTVDWSGPAGARVAPDYRQAATMTLLIEKPEDLVSSVFSVEVNGRLFAPAMFYTDKNAWEKTARIVTSNCNMQLKPQKNPLLAGCYKFKTTTKMLGNNPTIVPEMKLDSVNSEEFVKELVSHMGSV